MSSNLLKRFFTNVSHNDKRVIDNNEKILKCIESLTIKVPLPENMKFVEGLQAQNVAADLPVGEGTQEGTSGNVIKASEDAEKIREEANLLKEEAARVLEQANAEAQKLLLDAKEDAAREKNIVFEEAKKRGYEEGMRKVQQESERLRKETEEERKRLEAEYEQLIEEFEPQFIDTITSIYEHIFHVELSSYREILVYLISTTLHKIEGSRSFMIHVSKEDYPYVSMQKKQIAAGAASANAFVEVVEDVALSQNECMIETDSGVFDCGLGTQMSELKQKLKLLSYEK